ncbi:MAG: hypothetical protein RI920_1616 [Pseudomonadota bacterium]|jgi:uncharacterized protein (DUF2237 family)
MAVHLTSGRNVLGGVLAACSFDPLTGYFRDGCCRTRPDDGGRHVVCARLTDDFLAFSVAQGNDLVTPRPEYRFRGLQAGQRWCLCAQRWLDAWQAGCAPPVVLESTHESALELIPLDVLQACAYPPVKPAEA